MAGQGAPITVVGGGLGGLSLALALGRKGIAVRVLEQAPEIAPIGYGIQLGPNIFPMFERLGITSAIMRDAHVPPAMVMPDALTGEELIRIGTGSQRYRERFGHPYIVIHREDIHSILLDACARTPGVELTVNATVTGFEDRGDSVQVTCADGRHFESPALIGADGLRSVIRASFVQEEGPRPVGYVAHRTIVPFDSLPANVRYREDTVLWAGPAFHVVHYPLRHKTLFNIVAVFRTPTFAHRGDLKDYTAEVRSTYRDAHPVLHTLLDMMNLERRWMLADRDPIRHWSKGRVALLGDAAHPTLQSYAQGACMAIEDAVCLAELLVMAGGDYGRAFRAYEQARLVRTARVQLGSRSMWEFYHAEGIARDVRNAKCLSRSEEDFWRCLAWLWDPYQIPTALAA